MVPVTRLGCRAGACVFGISRTDAGASGGSAEAAPMNVVPGRAGGGGARPADPALLLAEGDDDHDVTVGGDAGVSPSRPHAARPAPRRRARQPAVGGAEENEQHPHRGVGEPVGDRASPDPRAASRPCPARHSGGGRRPVGQARGSALARTHAGQPRGAGAPGRCRRGSGGAVAAGGGWLRAAWPPPRNDRDRRR